MNKHDDMTDDERRAIIARLKTKLHDEGEKASWEQVRVDLITVSIAAHESILENQQSPEQSSLEHEQ